MKSAANNNVTNISEIKTRLFKCPICGKKPSVSRHTVALESLWAKFEKENVDILDCGCLESKWPKRVKTTGDFIEYWNTLVVKFVCKINKNFNGGK